MKTFTVYANIKIKLKAEHRSEVSNILENMDYSFTDPRIDIPTDEIEMDTEIWLWIDENGEPY